MFCLKDSEEYYLCLSDQPKRFDADSPVTNVFFDDTNGQVFTVRSGGVTGVTVNGMDDSKSTSFRMEDRGPIISIKFSPDHKILAIQRNNEIQNATIEFVNFKDLAPTNVEYSHTCKWKNAKILGFVWPKANEIAFVTDHGIELLHVVPEKQLLKSLKSVSFSGAWFSWCAPSNTVLLAGNNGALLQPFSLNNSTITKLQKLELDTARPVVERDVFLLRLCDATWCAVFRHGAAAAAVPGPTEVWLMGVGVGVGSVTHVLQTGLVGRFAVSVVDDLLVVHHQSSHTSQLFDIQEDVRVENSTAHHIPTVQGCAMKPASLGDQPCPMYSSNWVVFQPDYIIDARLGCLWRVTLEPSGLAHAIPKDEISKIVAVLLRRTHGKGTVYRILNQLVADAAFYLVELGKVFDEINQVYRKWAELEMARNTAGPPPDARPGQLRTVVSQADMCAHVLQAHSDDEHAVQVVTSYLASLSRYDMMVQHPVAELCVRTLVTKGACGRLRALVRRGCLGDSRPLACQLLSLGHIDPAAAQLALDMMWRLKGYEVSYCVYCVMMGLRRGCLGDSRPLACQLLSLGHIDPAAAQLALDMMWRLKGYEDIIEILLSWGWVVAGVGAARAGGGGAAWPGAAARKLLAAAKGDPPAFATVFRALQARNTRLRGAPHFLKGEQCDSYVEYYKQITSE